MKASDLAFVLSEYGNSDLRIVDPYGNKLIIGKIEKPRDTDVVEVLVMEMKASSHGEADLEGDATGL